MPAKKKSKPAVKKEVRKSTRVSLVVDSQQALAQAQAERDILTSIAKALVDQADYSRIGQIVGEKIQKFFQAEIAGIALYDEDAGMISVPYYYEKGKLKNVPPFKYGEGVASYVIKHRKPVYVPTAKEAEKYNVIYTAELPAETMIMSPILLGKKALGALSIQHSKQYAYGMNEVQILGAIANNMAVALENARLFNETSQRNAELAVINSVQEGLSRSLSLREIVDLVGEKIGEIFRADTSLAALYDAQRDWGYNAYYADRGRRVQNSTLTDGPVIRPSLFAHVVDSGKPLHISSTEEAQKLGAILQPPSDAEEDQNESILFVPIMAGEKVIGVTSVQSYKRNAFTKDDLRLLQTLAASMAVALENARLFDETSQRNAELAVINSVQEGLSRSLNLQEIIDLVGEKVGEIFHSDTVFAGLYDAARDWGSHIYYVDGGARVPVPDGPMIRPSLAAHVADTKKALLLGTKEEGEKLGTIRVVRTKNHEDRNESVLGVPIMKGNSVIGGISVQSYTRNAYSQADLRLLETLASSMSVALQNAQSFDETTQRNAELAVINSVQTALADELDIQAIYEKVGEKLREIFKVGAIAIEVFDFTANNNSYVYSFEEGKRMPNMTIPISDLSRYVWDQGDVFLLNTGAKEFYKRFGHKAPAGKLPKSVLSIKLPQKGKQFTAIVLMDIDHENAFSQADVQLLQTLAGSMSVALQNAQSFDETAQRNAELAVINSVQEALAKQTDIAGIYETVGEKIKEIFDAQAVVLVTFDHVSKLSRFPYVHEKGERFTPDPRPFSKLHEQLISTRKTFVANENFDDVMKRFDMVVFEGTEPTKSGVYVPLFAGADIIGLISLQNVDRENAFSESDVRLLETLGNSMSVALENARLFDETNQRNAELAVINSVQEAMAKQLDIKGIYEAVGEKIKDIFQAEAMILGAFDLAEEHVYPHYFYEKGERFFPDPFPFSGMIKHLVSSKKSVVINENFEEKVKEYGMKYVAGGDTSLSGVFVPLVVGDKVIGAITLQSDREHAFSEANVRLLETLANSMSVALENARLFDETTRRNAELAVINSVQEAVAKQMDIQGIYEAVGEKFKDIFDAQTLFLATLDSTSNLLVPRYVFERGERLYPSSVPPSSFSGEAMTTRKTILVNERFDERLKARGVELQEDWGELPKSAIYVPLISRDIPVGIISLQNLDREKAFSLSDVDLLETLSKSMSIALENARLFDETTQRNAELAIINSVQEGLSTKLQIQSIIDLVGEKLGEIFPDMDVVQINLYDQSSELIHIPYCREKGDRHQHDSRKPWGIRKLVLASRQAVINNNPQDDNRVAELFKKYGLGENVNPVIAGEPPKSVAFVPLIVGDQVSGIISLQSIARENAFSDSTVQLLTTLANSMSVALENARLFDETSQRNAELAVINSVQEGIASKLDVHAIYELVGEKLGAVFPNADVTVGRYDPLTDMATGEYVIEHGKRLPVGSFKVDGVGFIGELVRSPHTQVINENMEQAMQEHGSRIIPGTSMAKSFVNVPLVIDGVLHGLLQLQDMHNEHAFSESDVRLLETIAGTVSVALENARLFDETAQRNAELAIINSVQAALAEELDIQAIYDTVGQKLYEIFQTGVGIVNYDLEAKTRTYVYSFVSGEREAIITEPINDLHEFYLSQKRGYLNNNFHGFVGQFKSKPPFGTWPRSIVWVPLPSKGEKITALLLVDNDKENAFKETDVRLLETLGASMSVALDNARLFVETERLLDESRKKEEELSTINTVSQAVASELELASLIELIGVQVRKIFKADIAYLALYNAESDLIEFPYIFGDTLQPMKLGEGLASQVIQSKKPVLINRDEDWKEAEDKMVRVGTRSLSYLGVPILVGKTAIGAISVQSTQKAGRFNDADVHLLSTIAANVGAAIDNARLFAEVARQKEYFETFFQYSPAAVVVVDFNGTVISWNPAAQTLFGYTAEEAIGCDVDALVAADPRVEAEARMYTKKFTGELGRVEVKGQRTRKDGSLVDVEVKGLPIAVEGKMVGLLVIYHDISEIEQARRAAEEANQAKSAFLANMSHELRTPLNAIIGFTRIVRRKGEEALPEKQLENLDKVLVSAEHLLGLINTILDIAKIEAGRMELQLNSFDLPALVDGVLSTSQPLAKPGVQLLSSLPADIPRMYSDEEKIRQVLLNLLSNAAKFTHRGSITIKGELRGEMISLAVQDTGIGIAAENLAKIFEEFQQADNTTTREYGGTGLGLSISRSLAKLLGGDLTVASLEGEGSTFTLTLPLRLSAAAALSDGKQEMAEPALDPNKPVILVIDDQPDMFHILQQNLSDAGYQVVGALNGEEGIAKARSLQPFAITLDIMMPRKDGWQVLYELKNDPETKNIPVIILTIVDNKPMGFRLGASDYLVKPLSERSVLDALERLAKSNGGVHPRKLLVIDDDPRVIDMVRQTLEGEDLMIETAADGIEGLSRVAQSQPDAILLDLLMPRMDGFQFIDELKGHPQPRPIPIIVLTAKSLSNEESAQLEKSVAKIVQKQGLGSETLIKEIHQIISRPAETQ